MIHGFRDLVAVRKFRAKQAAVAEVIKAKKVYNNMNLIFTSNFTFSAAKQCLSILLAAIFRSFMKSELHGWKADLI